MNLQKKFYDDLIWSYKYRPNTMEDILLPEKLKTKFQEMTSSGKIPNLLLHGSAGTGKTTLAFIISNCLDKDTMYINGSKETSIDVLRGKISQFVTTVSFNDGKKLVIMDETDRISVQFQDALKGFLDEFSGSTTFVFITNHLNRIIDPLRSRLQQIDFNFSQQEQSELKRQFAKVVLDILTKEGVEYDKKVLGFLVKKYFPDMRKCLNEIQNLASQDRLKDASVVNEFGGDMETFYSLLRSRDFNGIQTFISNVSDSQGFYSKIYETCKLAVEPNDIPSVIILTNEYAYKSSFVADQRINLVAYSCELMNNVKIKE